MKKWTLANTILGIVGGICGVVGIVTGIKAAGEEEEEKYKALEDRYGLTPREGE